MGLTIPSVPSVIADLLAAAVWAYPTRRLTNLSDVRAALIDNVDVLVSSRLSKADFDTRLSAIRAARIDNLDVLLSSRLSTSDFDTRLSATRAARIDKIVTLEEHALGTLAADGSEQTVAELTALGTLEGYIDLANMQAGDTIAIKLYAKMKSGGTYRQYDSFTYNGVQTSPAIHVLRVVAKYGFKVTLQQTAGVNRNYDYNFFKEILA